MENESQRILVSLASRNNSISYDELMNALNIDNVRQLEDFVICAISQEVIKGRLNPRERKIEVNDWSSQKIGDNDVDLNALQNTLDGWIQHCDAFVSVLCNEVKRSNQHICNQGSREKRVEEEAEKIRKIFFAEKIGRNEQTENPFSKATKNDAKRYKGTALRLRRPNN